MQETFWQLPDVPVIAKCCRIGWRVSFSSDCQWLFLSLCGVLEIRGAVVAMLRDLHWLSIFSLSLHKNSVATITSQGNMEALLNIVT